MILAIFTDKLKAQAYADEVHNWLLKNRKDYKAEKWCDIELGKSDKAVEYYVKVPPDYEILNQKIIDSKERLTVSKDAVRTLSALPVDWKSAITGK